MKREYISDTIGNISTRHIREAESYEPDQKNSVFFKRPFGRTIVAAAVALCLLVGGIGVFSPFGGMAVTAYAYGTDEEITAAGVVVSTGTINDTGEMKGHPLMFYLSGKDIETVRFSCKNQQINFVDWTEKRGEYGNAQNFTVPYGEDESQYYYLVIDWIPGATIRELTDNAESTIATLPDELREDVIVMEITFNNGKTATKAITVSLLDDGTFFAAFDDYEISRDDDFIKRTDSVAIPRDILYGQGNEANNAEDMDAGKSIIEECYDDSNNPVSEQNYNVGEPNFFDQVDLEAVKELAQAYYSDTVFEVVSMELESQTEEELVFSVCVSKGGVVQEPNRTIWLELNNGKWEVTNEGY